jgi:hypothetical protein
MNPYWVGKETKPDLPKLEDLIKLVYVMRNDSSTFFVDSFTDLPAFAAKLSQRNGAVSQSLINMFGPETRKKLENQEATQPLSKALQELIIKELNAIIESNQIHDCDLFKGIVLRKKTQELLDTKPKGQKLIRLNRMLLEDAYPHEISKSQRNDVMPFSSQRDLVSQAYNGKSDANQSFQRLRLILGERDKEALAAFDTALNTLTSNGLWKASKDSPTEFSTPFYDALELIHLQPDTQ